MRRAVLVLLASGCFSTAPYDRAHTARVAAIEQRYDAALAREQCAASDAVPANDDPVTDAHRARCAELARDRLRERHAAIEARDAAIADARITRRAKVRAAAALAPLDRTAPPFGAAGQARTVDPTTRR